MQLLARGGSRRLLSKGVTVVLRGGLGNQLFGWAAGFASSERSGLELNLAYRKTRSSKEGVSARGFELGCFHGIPGTKISFSPRRTFLLGGGVSTATLITEEPAGEFDRRVKYVSQGTVLDGYFQDPRYFSDFTSQIRSILQGSFVHRDDISGINKSFGEEWVDVHVRRGDYTNLNKIYHLPGEEYYAEALSKLETETSDPNIVVFSDDPEAARTLVPNAKHFVGPSDLKTPGDSLMLMAMAPMLVGANSTFSWWAAFLNSNQRRQIFFPKLWLRSEESVAERLMLPGWKTIEI